MTRRDLLKLAAVAPVAARGQILSPFFSSGVAAPTPPVTGLVARYRPGALVGHSQGDQIATLPDLTGNGNDLTQPTGANQPFYDLTSMSGRPSLYFGTQTKDGGSPIYMESTSMVNDMANNTVVLIMDNGYQTATSNRNIYFSFDIRNTWQPDGCFLEVTNYGSLGMATPTFDERFLHAAGQSNWPMGPVCLVVSSNAGTIQWGWDGIRNTAGNTETSRTLTGFRVGRGPQAYSQDINILELLIYSSSLSPTDLTALNIYANSAYSTALTRKATNIACIGDSITAGFNQAGASGFYGRSYPWQLAKLSNRWKTINFQNLGFSGQTATQMDTDKSSYFPFAYDATGGVTNKALLLIGINDLRASVTGAATYAHTLSIGTYLKGLGYHVVAGTLIADNSGNGSPVATQVLAYNSLITGSLIGSGGADAVVDLYGNVPGFQYPTQDASLYQADLLHPSVTGYASMAMQWATVV